MVVSKVSPIVVQTANNLDYPPEVVADVVKYAFEFWKAYLKEPTKAGLRLPYFGVVRPHYKALNFYLRNLIKRMRENPDPKLREKFRIYWPLRHIIYEDQQRRDFKARYGSWHYKSTKDNE